MDFLPVEQSFRVVRLEEGDVKHRTDHLLTLRNLILENEPMYPEIAKWVSQKVLPGLRSSERVAFVGYLGEKPAVSAVVKRGAIAKFCHLRISEELQDAHLGEVFFALMANEVRDLAKDVYFTLPESLWSTKKEFFQAFHFFERTKAAEQYRLYDEELHCRASFAEVWKGVAAKVPKILELYSPSESSVADDLLLSVRPQYMDMILKGTKRVEIRRKFSSKWLGHVVNLYASGPVRQLVGQATVSRVVCKAPELIWTEFENEIGCSRKEFDQYTAGTDEIYAIELSDVTPFRVPVSRCDASELLQDRLVPPQSYCTLEKNRPWAKAISLAALLQGAFKGRWLSHQSSVDTAQRPTLSSQGSVLSSQVRRMFV
jgi:predicted transcriptional regulator